MLIKLLKTVFLPNQDQRDDYDDYVNEYAQRIDREIEQTNNDFDNHQATLVAIATDAAYSENVNYDEWQYPYWE